MSDTEFIRQMLQDLGPRDEGILAVLQTGDESWAVRFADVDVEIELDPQTRWLTLSTQIGVPPEERRLEIYELLLGYSLLWRETGGLRMAMTKPGGEAIMALDLHCSALTIELLAVVLQNLNERTLAWREAVAGEVEAAAEPPHPEFPMIQV